MVKTSILSVFAGVSLLATSAVADPILKFINGSHVAEYELEDLQDLPVTTFETSTIWTDGVQTFSGVSLADFLENVGVSQGTLRATALNDYAITLPVTDAVTDGPILAYLKQGETMNVRDKGPIWIVYPYDAKPEYQSELIYSRSIWQLYSIEVIDE